MKYIQQILQYKDKLGNFKGVDAEQIEELEAKYGLSFPLAYKEYLQYFGENTGNLLNGYYTEVKRIKEIYEDIELLFKTSSNPNKVQPPKNAFFFALWQGYNFFFFDCDGINENPPVKVFTDGFEIIDSNNTFIEFIMEEGINLILKYSS